MEDMVERIAKALWNARGDIWADAGQTEPWPSWEDETPALRDNVRSEAVAVLLAIQEPSDEMCERAGHYYHDNWRKGRAKEDTNVGDIWTEMVIEALASRQTKRAQEAEAA